MCGIIGVFNHPRASDKVIAALAVLQNRGRDGVGIGTLGEIQYQSSWKDLRSFRGKHMVGHALHAIINHVLQPLQKEGLLVANCEIYNWEKLNHAYKFHAQNDAEFLLYFLEKNGIEKLDELDGVYAFAYWHKNKLILARDLLGEKPAWYVHTTDGFAFASEKKALEKIGYVDIQELNPRHILIYTIDQNSLELHPRTFFDYLPEHPEKYTVLKEQTVRLLDTAITKRIPSRKFGLLFSGGVDSTYLAYYLKTKGYDFTCYTAVLDTTAVVPADLTYAQKVAERLGLKLKVTKLKMPEIPRHLQKIVPLIEDSNVVKVGVGLTFYLACEAARKDGCKVIFSGLGSEEIFAGYERHQNSTNINQECLSGLRKMYERDLYRDDVITMDNTLELRLPYLDLALVRYALKIPGKYKLKEGTGKFILRDAAKDFGIPPEFAFRKKTAAQYGSRFDYALGKLAREQKRSKSAYLRTFYPSHNLKLGVLFSSGKDSTYAAYIMQRQNYELTCLITMKSENPDSYMFQSAGTEIVDLQAESMGLPLVLGGTAGEKEEELKDLEKTIRAGQEKFKLDGIVTGAVFSTYQRDRIEKIGDKLGLKIFSPLWHKPQEEEMKELLQQGFTFVLSAVAAEGLDKSWLNKVITLSDLERLEKIHAKNGLGVAGEGGEFESVVLDCPLFHQKVELEKVEIIEENKNTAHVRIHKATLMPK